MHTDDIPEAHPELSMEEATPAPRPATPGGDSGSDDTIMSAVLD